MVNAGPPLKPVSQATGNLKPWREVITPHKGMAIRRYQQAEFAGDLWQVHVGEVRGGSTQSNGHRPIRSLLLSGGKLGGAHRQGGLAG